MLLAPEPPKPVPPTETLEEPIVVMPQPQPRPIAKKAKRSESKTVATAKLSRGKVLAIEDGCKICGCESDIGVIMCQQGEVLHSHYCSPCYNSHIRNGDGQGNPTPKKKTPPKQWTKPALELKKKGLRVQEKNGGSQLVVTLGRTVFDYWPSTEKYICRQSRTKGVGKMNMLIAIGLEMK